MFEVHWASASEYITYIISHVTSQEHVMKDHMTFLVKAPHLMSPPCQVCCNSHCHGEDIIFFNLARDTARP